MARYEWVEGFGARVRTARKARGWLQGDLASHARIGLGMVTQIENKSAVTTGNKSARKIADVLGLDFHASAEPRACPHCGGVL
jgi:ribosome-binding protein aMBF1 (putative translation factor)